MCLGWGKAPQVSCLHLSECRHRCTWHLEEWHAISSSRMEGYLCVQTCCGGRKRSTSCAGDAHVRAGGGGGRCASSTRPVYTVPRVWCCCHRATQQRGPRLTTELPHLYHSLSGQGVPLYRHCTVSAPVSVTGNNYSTVLPRERKKYWCWLASGINCYISSHSLPHFKLLLSVFSANF